MNNKYWRSDHRTHFKLLLLGTNKRKFSANRAHIANPSLSSEWTLKWKHHTRDCWGDIRQEEEWRCCLSSNSHSASNMLSVVNRERLSPIPTGNNMPGAEPSGINRFWQNWWCHQPNLPLPAHFYSSGNQPHFRELKQQSGTFTTPSAVSAWVSDPIHKGFLFSQTVFCLRMIPSTVATNFWPWGDNSKDAAVQGGG